MCYYHIKISLESEILSIEQRKHFQIIFISLKGRGRVEEGRIGIGNLMWVVGADDYRKRSTSSTLSIFEIFKNRKQHLLVQLDDLQIAKIICCNVVVCYIVDSCKYFHFIILFKHKT